MARWLAKTLSPENRRRLEDVVALRSWIDGSRPVLRVDAALERRAFSDDFQPLDLRRIAVVLPADKTGDAVTLLHASAFKDPMIRFRAYPITTAIHRDHVDGPHEESFIGTGRRILEPLQVIELLLPRQAAIGGGAGDGAVRSTVRGVAEGADPADRVARQEQHVYTSVPQGCHAMVLAHIPVFVVPGTDEGLALEASLGREHVAV